MSENNSGDTLFTLLVGAAIGAAAGLLLAPRAGRESRRRLRAWLDEVEEDFREEGADELWEKGKKAVREQAGAVKDKVESVIKDAWKTREGREGRGQS